MFVDALEEGARFEVDGRQCVAEGEAAAADHFDGSGDCDCNQTEGCEDGLVEAGEVGVGLEEKCVELLAFGESKLAERGNGLGDDNVR
jgi:hypothetical protein